MDFLKELIERYSEFKETNPDTEQKDIRAFIGYLNSFYSESGIEKRNISGGYYKNDFAHYSDINSEISVLLVYMFRYAKCYIKKALSGSSLQTGDEFSFLITLMSHKSMSKTELITNQVMEKTSGTEIIRRLAARALIKESPDRNDKRKVRISITEKGIKEIRSILPVMNKVAGIISGNLSMAEKRSLLYLLKKLDHFHNDIFTNRHDTAIEDIKVNYTGKAPQVRQTGGSLSGQ